VAPGVRVFRLKQIDFDGTFEYSQEVEVTMDMPETFVLHSAYPNPFNPATNIEFAVNTEQVVSVNLYDLTGRFVRAVFSGTVPALETQTLQLNGDGLVSGHYIVRLIGSQFEASERITLLK
jgi:hypothetical protein